MKQKGVTGRAISILKKECEKEFEFLNLTKKQAFVMPALSLGKISASGRTIRKVFNGVHVQESTIRKLIEVFGFEQSIYNGKIDIKNETEEKEEA